MSLAYEVRDMEKINAWFLEREQKKHQAEDFIAENTDPDGNLSPQNAAQAQKMTDEIKFLSQLIGRELEKPSSAPILSDPSLVDPLDPFGIYGRANAIRPGVQGREYHRNFIRAFRTSFKSPQVLGYLQTGVQQDGGYLVPEEFDAELVTKLAENNILRDISKVITTASTHQINIVADEPAAAWIAEGAEIQLGKAQFNRKTLGAHKLAIGTKVTNELLQDSFYDLEAALVEIFARSISAAEEEAFVNGTGDGEPRGLLSAMAQSASTFITSKTGEITADDVIALYYTIERPYRRNAVWLASDAAVENLRRLRDANQAFLWCNSLVDGEPPTLLGAKVYTSPALPAVSSGNVPLIFGDFKDYFVIGDRGTRQVRPLRELYALSDCTAYLMLERCDCCVTDLRAFRGLKIK